VAGSRTPGPQGLPRVATAVDDGTRPRTAMPPPGPTPAGATAGPAKALAAGAKQDAVAEAKSQTKAALEVAGLPETLERQLLVGVIYAESGSKAYSGEENADEKLAIGWTFVNRAYYAQFKPVDGKHKCYNESFGDGTLVSAVKTGSAAYNPVDKDNKKVDNAPWYDIMNGNRLKSLEDLAKSLEEPAKLEHFKLSVEAANKIDPYVKKPRALPKLGERIPVAFNQATNQPPSPQRMERIGKLGVHTFYGFKPGRECA
jgi:hypothetical protein